MSRHVNHRGWIVIDSVVSRDGVLCVDLFEHPGGRFGFEHFRSDPEDGGRWTAIGSFSARRFDSLAEAAHASQETIAWLAHTAGWASTATRTANDGSSS